MKTAPVWVRLPAVPECRLDEPGRVAGATLADPAVVLEVPVAAPLVLLPAAGAAGLDEDVDGVDADAGLVVAPPEEVESEVPVAGAAEPVGAGVVVVTELPVAGAADEVLEDDAEVGEDGCWPRAWATRYMSGSTFSTSDGAACA